jgi:protease IV
MLDPFCEGASIVLRREQPSHEHLRNPKGAGMSSALRDRLLPHGIPTALWFLLPLTAGILLSLLIPQPAIGIIYFRDAIYPESSSQLVAQLRAAGEHPEIRAVVLVMDSPGGTVSDTEKVYLELARLRERKPVVTLVEGMAASGGYYIAAGTDRIVVHPSSLVGNVGVRVVLPEIPAVFEDEISTGPYKFYGDSRDATLRSLDPIKRIFFQAVTLGRGSALKATADEVLSGKLYLGTEAVRLGLADRLGTVSDAEETAAGLVHIWNYRIQNLLELAGESAFPGYSFFRESANGTLTPYPREAGIYLLFIPSGDWRLP